MRTIGFRGYPWLRSDHTHEIRPYGYTFAVGDTLEVSGDLAASQNRLCGDTEKSRKNCHDKHDGDCWARLMVAAENAAFPPSIEPPFYIVEDEIKTTDTGKNSDKGE